MTSTSNSVLETYTNLSKNPEAKSPQGDNIYYDDSNERWKVGVYIHLIVILIK